MYIQYHALSSNNIGFNCQVTSLHFGVGAQAEVAGASETTPTLKKIYIQSSLHADELPGSLLLHELRKELLALEQNQLLSGHIVLVPLCNPIGLQQRLMFGGVGRFDLETGRNFNRFNGVQWLREIERHLPERWSNENRDNIKMFRQAMCQALVSLSASVYGVAALQNLLLRLAVDADLVLDLHCDENAIPHVYTSPTSWPLFSNLARRLNSQCQLLTEGSDTFGFDEMLYLPWQHFSRELGQKNSLLQLPQGCHSITVELGGQNDVNRVRAKQDAGAILDFLKEQGFIQQQDSAPLPDLLREPHPLSGLVFVRSHQSGVLVYHAKPGAELAQGDLVAEVIDPILGLETQILCPIDGVVMAHSFKQFVKPGEIIYTISGSKDLGLGETLSP